MNDKLTFGQYYPVNSFVHSLDARFKLLATVLYIVMLFLVRSFSGYAVAAAFMLCAIIASRVPLLSVLKTVKTVLFLIIFATVLNIFFFPEGEVWVSWKFITITKEGVLNASYMILRLILLVTGTSLLVLTTTPMSLTRGIESLCSPLKVLHVPVHDFAITMSIALRFIPTLMEETDRIMKAQRARGAAFDEGGLLTKAKTLLSILIPLFVSAIRRADELGLALDARCYNAVPNPTSYKVLRFSYRDLIGSFFIVGSFTAIMLDRFLLGGLF